MKTSSAAVIAVFGLLLTATPLFAVETEDIRQSPAPQSTTTPSDRNAKAQQPSVTDDGKAVNRTKEETNTQSPGNAEATDLTKKAETPSKSPNDASAPKDEAKTPANTEPDDLNKKVK
jgi:hypothetical protein